MTDGYLADALPAFARSWRTVCREAAGLQDVADRLFDQPLDAAWLALRALRNRLVHEYLESVDELLLALQVAKPAASQLIDVVRRMDALLQERGIALPGLAS